MKTLSLLFAGLILSSCGERSALEFSDRDSFSLGAEVDFASVQKSIFQPNCVSCHKQYATYDGVKSDLQKIVSSVETNRMPKNADPLSDVQKQFLNKWVSLGAPLGNIQGIPDDGKLKPTWESLSTKVFGPKCIQCHNPQGEAKFLDLSSRQEIWKERAKLFNFESPESSYFLEVIQNPDEPMPPVSSGLSPLNEEEIIVIRKWIEDGLP